MYNIFSLIKYIICWDVKVKKNIIQIYLLIIVAAVDLVQASSSYRYLHPMTNSTNSPMMITIDEDDQSLSDNDGWKPWDSPIKFDYSSIIKDTQHNEQELITNNAMGSDNDIYADDIIFGEEFKANMLQKFDKSDQALIRLSLPHDSQFDKIKLQTLMSDIEVRHALQANIDIMNASKINGNVTRNWLLVHFDMMLFQLFVPDFLDNINLFSHCDLQRNFTHHEESMYKIIFLAPHVLMNHFLAYYDNHQHEQEQLRQEFLPLFQEINEVALKQSERLRRDGRSDKYLRVYRKPKFQNLLHTMEFPQDDHIVLQKAEEIFW